MFSLLHLRTSQQSTVRTDYNTNYYKNYFSNMHCVSLCGVHTNFLPLFYFSLLLLLTYSWQYAIKRIVRVFLHKETVIYLSSARHRFRHRYMLIILPYCITYFCLSFSVLMGVIGLKHILVFRLFHESMKSKG